MPSSLVLTSPVHCRACGSTDNHVTNARAVAWWVRRRRQCQDCGYRWTTYEMVVNPRKLRPRTPPTTYNP